MADHPCPPLWRAMRTAYDESLPSQAGKIWEDEDGYAAEIRAVADWLVPEDACPHTSPGAQVAWATRYGLRQLLLDEAGRAEAGE